MRIEPATSDDVATIAQLNVAIHDLHCQLAPDYFRAASPPAAAAELKELLADMDSRALIAWEEDVPVGYCVLKIVQREPNAWSAGFRRILVDALSVEPQWRRRGVGTRLMEAAFAFAREQGIRELMLEYWSNNAPAREFYKSMGFAPLTEKVLLTLPEEGQ